MDQIRIVCFILALGLLAGAQDSTPKQPLTEVPPKPTCHWIFKSGPCNDLWTAYNQAKRQRGVEELQLYVNRQKELASSQASAPLQQQIADLTKLSTDQQEQVKQLQEQMQADSTSASQAKTDAHKQGLSLGAGIGAGSMILLFTLIFAIRKVG